MTDPPTSRAAAESAVDLRREHHAKILAFLATRGVLGGTYREIALGTGLEPVQVGRRMVELIPPTKCRLCQSAVTSYRGAWHCTSCSESGIAPVVVEGERELSTKRPGRVFVKANG